MTDTMITGGNVTKALLPIIEGKFSVVFDETKRSHFDSVVCGGNFKNPHTELSDDITKHGYEI